MTFSKGCNIDLNRGVAGSGLRPGGLVAGRFVQLVNGSTRYRKVHRMEIHPPGKVDRRAFLAGTAAAAGGLLAAGAIDHAEAAGRLTSPVRDQVELTFWSHQFTPKETLDKIHIKEFERQNP